jgi:ubiquinone/menaquinone biosynthesis C-methylase UbiE
MQTLYNELAEYFDAIAAASAIDTQKEIAFLASVFSEHDVHSVLDIACGTGRHSVALAAAGYDVTGIDYSDKLLKIARGKTDLPNVTFMQQDVTHIKLDRTFDAAICMWSTFGELPYKEMLSTLKAALNPGGVFIIDTTYYAAVPSGSAHKTYTNEANGLVIHTEIDEVYKGITRVREITNTINGKTFKDHSEMDVLTESDFVELLAGYGFRHKATHYDYSQTKPADVTRLQLVFTV